MRVEPDRRVAPGSRSDGFDPSVQSPVAFLLASGFSTWSYDFFSHPDNGDGRRGLELWTWELSSGRGARLS